MACGKTVFFMLAIVALVSCAPTEKDSRSSWEENSPLEREPPPYHQTPLDDTEEHSDSHGQNIRCEHHDKADASSGLPMAKEENDPSKLELPSFSFNCSEDHYNRLFGIDSNSAFPFSQLFGFSGLNGSSPLSKIFQNPLQPFIDAFGIFIPGLGGNSSDLLNLFSGFLPHSRTQRSIQLPGDVATEKDLFQSFINAFGMFIPGSGGNSSDLLNFFSGFLPHSRTQRSHELPGDVAAENGTEDIDPHDRIFFALFNSFLQTFFQDSSSRYVSIGCNYTTQAGYSCSGCREQLICNTNNVGRIRICPRNAPYCYNGVCGSIVNTTACTTTTTTG